MFTAKVAFGGGVCGSTRLAFFAGFRFVSLMWKGRTFQLFFIWLIGLELILDWETIMATKLNKLLSPRALAFAVALVLPTLYVVASYYGGLNGAITNWATQSNIQWADSMALSTEYLVFTLLFCLIIWLSAGIKGVKAFFVPTFFLVHS